MLLFQHNVKKKNKKQEFLKVSKLILCQMRFSASNRQNILTGNVKIQKQKSIRLHSSYVGIRTEPQTYYNLFEITTSTIVLILKWLIGFPHKIHHASFFNILMTNTSIQLLTLTLGPRKQVLFSVISKTISIKPTVQGGEVF